MPPFFLKKAKIVTTTSATTKVSHMEVLPILTLHSFIWEADQLSGL